MGAAKSSYEKWSLNGFTFTSAEAVNTARDSGSVGLECVCGRQFRVRPLREHDTRTPLRFVRHADLTSDDLLSKALCLLHVLHHLCVAFRVANAVVGQVENLHSSER
jgi:hypothetical protein